MSAEKELYLFDSDLWGTGKWAPSMEEYLSHFAAADRQKKIGEATPSYLRSLRAPLDIKAFSPEAQIIVMLRDPVDVMYSLHSLALDGAEAIGDFETALKADPRRAGREHIGYQEFTDFAEQVERYFDVFGRENVYTVIYDDLKADSAAVGHDLLRFLGVRNDFGAAFPWIHGNKQSRSPRLHLMLTRPPAPVRTVGRALVPPRWRAPIRRFLAKSNRVMRPRPAMDADLRRRLQCAMAPKIDRLSKLLGRDLSAWQG